MRGIILALSQVGVLEEREDFTDFRVRVSELIKGELPSRDSLGLV